MAVDKKRALTDETYRKSLTPEQLVELEAALTEDDLEQVAGGRPCETTRGSCLGSKRSTITCSGSC
jgi:hypothetical protein